MQAAISNMRYFHSEIIFYDAESRHDREPKSAHFKAGSVAVDLNVIQDHLGITSEGFTAVGAQVFLKHCPVGDRS